MFSYVDKNIREQLVRNHQLIDLSAEGKEITTDAAPFISVLGPVTIPCIIDDEEIPLEWYPFVRRLELSQVLEAAQEVTDSESEAFRELLQANMSVNSVFALPGFRDEENPLVRIHSCCLTGDIFRSLRCDCGPQLSAAFSQIKQQRGGAVVYMSGHEGAVLACGPRPSPTCSRMPVRTPLKPMFPWACRKTPGIFPMPP